MTSAHPVAGEFDRAPPLTTQEGEVVPPGLTWAAPRGRRGRLRRRTLVLLRWLAVAGQTAIVLAMHFLLQFDLPLAACLGVIAVSAWVNVVLTFVSPGRKVARDWEAAGQLAFDVVQLSALLALTGGMQNPFSLLLIAPATVAAANLPARQSLFVGLMALLATCALALWSFPPPSPPGQSMDLPPLYEAGVWFATVIGIIFTAGYAWQAAAEAARMEVALAATEAVLAREQRLSALGGLAAAVAHELGTPLATIQVVAKELLRSTKPGDPVADDAALLVSQAERCRDILKQLSQKPDDGDIVHARLGLGQLLEESVEPYREIGPRIETLVEGPPGEFVPDVKRLPEVVHALSSWVENAADFAALVVTVTGYFDSEHICVEVKDDGPGFSPDVLAKLGEPYVTSRPHAEGSRSHHQGMGLGFFIAKTLLERTGAVVSFGNSKAGGAVITAKWPRDRLEAS